jgi:phosphatidylserine/phosphatidylglycerophosphate/cardiolipin synthase-like enzyme
MHLKLAVIDQEVIILGSYNWTDPAERRNKETLEIKRSREYGERLIGNIDGIR